MRVQFDGIGEFPPTMSRGAADVAHKLHLGKFCVMSNDMSFSAQLCRTKCATLWINSKGQYPGSIQVKSGLLIYTWKNRTIHTQPRFAQRPVRLGKTEIASDCVRIDGPLARAGSRESCVFAELRKLFQKDNRPIAHAGYARRLLRGHKQ